MKFSVFQAVCSESMDPERQQAVSYYHSTLLSAGFFHTESRKFTWTQVEVSQAQPRICRCSSWASLTGLSRFSVASPSLASLCVWSCSIFLSKRKKIWMSHLGTAPTRMALNCFFVCFFGGGWLSSERGEGNYVARTNLYMSGCD